MQTTIESKTFNMENNFYVYLHVKLDTGEPFYVGKGIENRAYSKYNRSNWWKNIVKKYDYDIILLEENLTEVESFEKEVNWIKRIGRKDKNQGTLINLTDGGDGAVGQIMSKEARQKISLSQTGEKNNRFGKTISETNLIALKKANSKPKSDETKKKMSEAKKGKTPWNKGLKFTN